MTTPLRPRRGPLLLLVSTALLFAIVWVSILLAGPETVPGQFAPDGTPTRWEPTLDFLVVMGIIAAGAALLVALVPMLVARVPLALLNVPHRELWNSPDRRARLAALVTDDVRLIGAATMLLLTAVLVISALEGLGAARASWVLLAVTGGYLVAVVLVIVRVIVSGRYVPPADTL